MRKDETHKLVFIRIICLVGIIGEVLFPNSTVGILFGLILAITSVIFLLMLKNEMALEKSDCENNYSISIMALVSLYFYSSSLIHNTERFSNYYAVGYARIFLF